MHGVKRSFRSPIFLPGKRRGITFFVLHRLEATQNPVHSRLKTIFSSAIRCRTSSTTSKASGRADSLTKPIAIWRFLASSGSYVDVHGGWYDATGDYGIHLSHQNPTSYFNPQQVPLVAWSLLTSYRILEERHDDNFGEYERRMLDEGLYGADYLVRIKRPNGSFFETISAPGKEKLASDRAIGNPNWRTRIKTNKAESTESIATAAGPHAYEASFRAGGGMSIAALALASTMPIDGDYARSEYLKAAEDAFQFLDKHNVELLNDGIENILDDYCALMAATELFHATHKAGVSCRCRPARQSVDGAPHRIGIVEELLEC